MTWDNIFKKSTAVGSNVVRSWEVSGFWKSFVATWWQLTKNITRKMIQKKGYTPVSKHSTIEDVFPIEDGDIPASNISVPEGRASFIFLFQSSFFWRSEGLILRDSVGFHEKNLRCLGGLLGMKKLPGLCVFFLAKKSGFLLNNKYFNGK